MLDAPVSGGDVGARNGTLSIMVGGPKETFEVCEPILKILGHKIVHVGAQVGMGGHAKLANQILVAVTLAGMGEALVYGAKAGIDPALLVEAMSAGLARCGSLDIKAPKVLAGDFTTGRESRLAGQRSALRHAHGPSTQSVVAGDCGGQRVIPCCAVRRTRRVGPLRHCYAD